MIGNRAFESFGILDNAEHDSELYVLSATFSVPETILSKTIDIP